MKEVFFGEVVDMMLFFYFQGFMLHFNPTDPQPQPHLRRFFLSRKAPYLTRTSMYDQCSGSMKITTHLNHISHYKLSSGKLG